MTLIKININSEDSIKMADFRIQHFIELNPTYKGLIIVDCFDNIHTKIDRKFIPQIFNNQIVYISALSFQQNNLLLGKKTRSCVNALINNATSMICIGGESYLYGLTNKIHQIYHLTNSSSIFEDCQKNSQYFNSIISNNLMDYNKLSEVPKNFNCALINLSLLNSNLLKLINKSNVQEIVIINCNMNDFWNKIKLLTKYKIKTKQYFICCKLKYYISVTQLIKK